MKFIQSFWSCGNEDLLTASSGWYAPEYHLMGWALSCLQLKKFHENVVLYADSKTAKLLIEILELPYANVICNLNQLDNYHKHLWALPKIYTYAQQDEPFLHVDGDVFIWKPFSDDLLKSNLIAQNKEVSTTYSEKALALMINKFAYFPEEILEERKTQKKIYAYNAGIFGGSDTEFFKVYAFKATTFVDENITHLENLNVHDFNIIFEQYLFYALAKKQDKKVDVLYQGLFHDHGYKEFAEFINVPYDWSYLHLMGGFKKNPDICNQLAKQLRNNYPEYYYKIIQLFKNKNITLKKDYYYFLTEDESKNLFDRFEILRQPASQVGTPLIKRNTTSTHWRSDYANLFLCYTEKNYIGKLKATELLDDIKNLEKNIDTVLLEKFALLNNNLLYKRDLLSDNYNDKIFFDKKNTENIVLSVDKFFKIVISKFDWTLFEEGKPPYKKLFKKVLLSEGENHIAIIPQCHIEGYSILHLGEIDLLILELLNEPSSIKKLLEEIEVFFDVDDLKKSYSKFQSLIYYRIKILVVNNLLKLNDNFN